MQQSKQLAKQVEEKRLMPLSTSQPQIKVKCKQQNKLFTLVNKNHIDMI